MKLTERSWWFLLGAVLAPYCLLVLLLEGPLEKTYEAAFDAVPKVWRERLSG
jgi:hypothetical protein